MAELEVSGITKRFGDLTANDNISFAVRAGQVLAILGENGAGKSTLMKVVSGFLRPDAGRVLVDGHPLPAGDPEAAIRAGIGMIHQHFMLIPRMTVLENLILGQEPRTRFGGIDRRRGEQLVRELADRFGMEIDPRRTVESLTVGEQQRIEIIKAFYRGAKILILDEPTALLTPQETDRLFESIREFSRQGLAVVFISHKLDEVREIAPQVMVIRAGRVVGTVPTQHSSPSELARMMVGREVDLGASRRQSRLGDAVLTVTGLTASAKGGLTVGPIDLTIRAGEILGVAGVEGNGQHELVELLAGLRTPTAGTIQMGQQALQNLSVRRRLEAGLAYVPADRQGQGLVLDLKIWENFILRDYYRAPLRRGLGIDSRAARARAQAAADAFDIRTGSIELPSRSLSGGNQQKLLLAREMSRQPRVMIVSQPTRGLDVGAIEYVHRQLMVLADGGAGVLLVSLELDELMKLSDRILVLFRGQVHGIVDRAAFRREKVGLLMAGQVAREEEVAP